MNNKVIKKALEELNKESPRLDYVRGMLEVIAGDEESDTEILVKNGAQQVHFPHPILETSNTTNLLFQDKKIQDLLGEMSSFIHQEKTIEETIQKLTQLEFKPENFNEIIAKLEAIKDKVKIIDSSEQGGTIITTQK